MLAAGPFTNKGLEYPLEDLQRTLALNTLEEAAELCEAVGLETMLTLDNTPVAVFFKVRHLFELCRDIWLCGCTPNLAALPLTDPSTMVTQGPPGSPEVRAFAERW